MKTLSPYRASSLFAIAAALAVAFAFAVCPSFALAAEQASGSGAAHLYASAEGDLTADTATAATDQMDDPTIVVCAKVKSKGWLKKVAAGKTAGTKGKKSLRSFRVYLSKPAGMTGHIKYRTYDMGKGWGKTVKDGKATGRSSRAVQGVKIWLTGQLGKEYDVKYRAYIKGKGWLPWVTDKQVAGITGGSQYVSAIQVKLIAQLDGIDISSWQEGLNPAKVEADFIIVKSTEGTWYTNPYFKKWADATLQCGKLLGTYHFASKGNAVKQADYFVDTVGEYVGQCVLFLDWEADALSQGPSWAKKFMDRVYERTGVKPLIYMSKSVCRNYNWSDVAPTYGLWVAQYAYKYQNNGTGYLSSPWTDSYGYGAWDAPTLYQYTSAGRIPGYDKNLDLDLFYGSAADWRELQEKAA